MGLFGGCGAFKDRVGRVGLGAFKHIVVFDFFVFMICMVLYM